MEYVQLSLDDYIQCKTEIKENLTGIVKSFVKIGWQLTRIEASKAYTLDGYNSIVEFAKAEYGMSRSGVSRFMGVYKRYSVQGDTPELQEQYKNFKFEQLKEMLQLTEEDQQLIDETTKREDIRELKRFNEENEHNPDMLMNWKNGEENKIHETIFEFFKSYREILNDLFGSEAYRAGSLEQMVDIVNPSGSRSYRKGTVFMMMYGPEKGIMVKQAQKGTETMSWSEFFGITQDLFGEKAAGGRTWEAYFEQKSQKTAQTQETGSALEDAFANTEIAPAQQIPEKEEKDQKIALAPEKIEAEPVEKATQGGENLLEKKENVENIPENISEEQIPGQDSILNHEEYMPKPETKDTEKKEPPAAVQENIPEAVPEPMDTSEEPVKADLPVDTEPSAGIAPAQPQEVVEKPIRRKEYMDSLTEYGAAEYMGKSFRDFGKYTFSQLQSTPFWLNWFNVEVDHNGRPWEK